ncbi:helix-turn-helix transcriptional regulator [Haloechinothrix sp. YIM 98757]|uniref:Helix-turn-helix transcriptional regulator n=1 Tax=Haloechinothrix aidingensis TaxID=2752311 RepID=A0A838A694_9PSEU|nr:metalloregulator ArsR/SmtB family transcription factor [Haloechinothrix aidingensis]MBA0124355.1 helix-turn-helix transcriptional regulator [Haloechinothrix aidingensis]
MDGSCYSPLVREPLGEERARQLAGTLKAVAEPVRLRLLSLIASRADGEACVCELTGAFEVSDATISHHLKVLREAGLIERERRGTWLYYRVRPEALRTIAGALMPAEDGAVPA